MPVLIYWLLAGGAAAAGAGYLAKSSADAVQETANGAVKIATVGAVIIGGYLVAKHMKVI